MLRSRRFALAAAAVVLGLSACGDADRRTVGASTPPVIQLGESGAVTGSAAAATEAASDRMMMPMQAITFVYDGDAADLGDQARAWTLPAGAQVDVERVARIAALLGVEGEVRELSADQGGGWMVGAADYTTATITVSRDGMLSWWYNPAPMQSVDVSCVLPDDVTVTDDPASSDVAVSGETMPSCATSEPPANVPDEAAARAAAEQLFADMGYDLGALDYDVYADEWGANVTGWLLLDGARSPISVSVGFGADGAVTWASGALAEPEQASDYPLVTIEAAVARLNDETGQWMNYSGSPMVSARMEAQSEPAEGSDVPVEPEALTVHLTGVGLELTMVWAQDGAVWLLPAYMFTTADEGQYSVIAIDDSFIAMPEPVLIDPLPAETIPGETIPATEPVVPTVVGESVVVDLDVAQELLVGLTVDEATAVAADQGWTVRVSTLDREPQPVTMDLQANRVNLSVVDGTVVAIDGIG